MMSECPNFSVGWNFIWCHLSGCLYEKTRTGASFIPGWLFDLVSRLHDDWVISYLVIWRHTSCCQNTCLIQNRKRYACATSSSFTGRLISHQNVWSFRDYMIPLLDFEPEWNSRLGTTTGVNSCWGDSHRHVILRWYHVNKCRAMRGNQSELAPTRKSPRCHVNPP